jgi:hypothetical protein
MNNFSPLMPSLHGRYEEVSLEKLRLACRMHLGAGVEVKASSYLDYRLQAMVVELDAAIWARKIGSHTERWPATWWDAVKERFVPQRFRQYVTINYRGINVDAYHTYPTLAIKSQYPRLQIHCADFNPRLP